MSLSKPQPMTLTIKQFIDIYIKGHIIKPYHQRKRKWDNEKDKGYVQFAIKNANTVTIFILNEKIKDGIKYYYVWDGNNRTNALLSFYNKPLELMSELIPKSYPIEIQNIFKSSSLEDILKNKNFKTFCFNKDKKDWYRGQSNNDDNDTLDSDFEKLQDELRSFNFNDIILNTTVFQNEDDETMVNIYENVNRGGDPISYQDVLAAKTHNINYNSTDIDLYKEIMKEVINNYHNNENSELLKTDIESFKILDSLNLYQVLFGFQLYLSKNYKIIPSPGNETMKSNSLDLVFDIYKYLIDNTFDTKHDINTFINTLEKSTELLNKYINDIYYNEDDTKKNDTKKNSDKVIPKNSLLRILTYLYVNNNVGLEKNIKAIILYHLLMACSPKGKYVEESDKEKKKYFEEYDSLKYEPSSTFLQNKMKNIIEKKTFNVPPHDKMRELLEYINTKSINNIISDNKKRKKNTSDFIKICLATYFNLMVPNSFKLVNKELDHIIPFSSNYEGTLDVNRLGNLMYMNSSINNKKSNNMLTDKFIKDNNLYYYHYPTETEYKQIINKNKIICNNKYNIMCEKREKIFFDKIIESISN
jgi:hypothetical protein